MRFIRHFVLLLIVCSPLSAQNWKFGAVPLSAAQVVAGLPGSMESVEDIRQNYVAAALPLHDGTDTILVEGRGGSPVCGAQNCPAYILERRGGTYRLLLNAEEVQQVHILNSLTISS